MELRPTSRYPSRHPSRGLSADDSWDAPRDDEAAGPVSIDGLEVVDEQVVALAPLDAPGRRRPTRSGRGLG